jgi:hypothetical protein
VDPEWSVEPCNGGWALAAGAGRVRVTVRGPAGLGLAVEPAAYHPEYGLDVPAQRLCWAIAGELPVDVRTEVREA